MGGSDEKRGGWLWSLVKFAATAGVWMVIAAIGVAWSHPDAVKTFAQLVHDANVAMYRAKADQLEQPLCFDASLGLETDARRALEADIDTGLEREEFRVVYQPIVDAQTGRTVSVEALLRWEHPTRGAVPPGPARRGGIAV